MPGKGYLFLIPSFNRANSKKVEGGRAREAEAEGEEAEGEEVEAEESLKPLWEETICL